MKRRPPSPISEAAFDAFIVAVAVIGVACTALLIFLSGLWIYQAVLS